MLLLVTEDLKKKERCSSFCFSPSLAKRDSLTLCQYGKNFFYDNSAGFGGNRAVYHENKPTMNFFEAVEMKSGDYRNSTRDFEEQKRRRKENS
jgi:hypothetical protein